MYGFFMVKCGYNIHGMLWVWEVQEDLESNKIFFWQRSFEDVYLNKRYFPMFIVLFFWFWTVWKGTTITLEISSQVEPQNAWTTTYFHVNVWYAPQIICESTNQSDLEGTPHNINHHPSRKLYGQTCLANSSRSSIPAACLTFEVEQNMNTRYCNSCWNACNTVEEQKQMQTYHHAYTKLNRLKKHTKKNIKQLFEEGTSAARKFFRMFDTTSQRQTN